MFKGVIFDLDGTVLDTLTDITNSVNFLMNDYNLKSYTKEEIKQKVGRGFYNLIKDCLNPNESEDKINETLNIFINYYDKEYYKTTKPYDDIKELIDTLLNNNIKVGINSNKKDIYTNKLISINFPNIDLNYVLGKREDKPIKPNPINNIDILNRMGLNREEVLYVGDSLVDIETARNTNLIICAVSWGFRSKEELLQNKPDFIVDNPLDILKIVGV